MAAPQFHYDDVPSPCFILDMARLQNNLELIREIQDRSGIQILMALKGFAQWRLFPFIKPYIAGCATSSLWENLLCEEAFGWKAHTYAPAYRPDEFSRLLRKSSHVIFNSWQQIQQFKKDIVANQQEVSFGIRVNPGYSDVVKSLYNPVAPGSRLGVLCAQLPAQLPHFISGFHYHVHCESRAEAFQEGLLSFESNFSSYFSQIHWVNLGGGHLLTASDYDLELFYQTVKGFKKRYPWLTIYMEPSAAFVWHCGELVTTVLDIVENGRVKTAIVDSSFTAHMPDTLEMPYQPSLLGASKTVEDGQIAYRLGGVSCLSGDFLPAYGFDRALCVGDRLILMDMIQYTTVKSTMFNGVRHLAIAIRKLNGDLKILRQFYYEDYKNRMA